MCRNKIILITLRSILIRFPTSLPPPSPIGGQFIIVLLFPLNSVRDDSLTSLRIPLKPSDPPPKCCELSPLPQGINNYWFFTARNLLLFTDNSFQDLKGFSSFIIVSLHKLSTFLLKLWFKVANWVTLQLYHSTELSAIADNLFNYPNEEQWKSFQHLTT